MSIEKISKEAEKVALERMAADVRRRTEEERKRDSRGQMEEHYRLTCDVANRAIMFRACKVALLEAYQDGCDATGPRCHELQGHIHDAEQRLDRAVEALEAWLKDKGQESEESL